MMRRMVFRLPMQCFLWAQEMGIFGLVVIVESFVMMALLLTGLRILLALPAQEAFMKTVREESGLEQTIMVW